jgi:hypothetical protein
MEAARAWGVPMDRWLRLEPDLRARMLAHEVERNLREGFLQDHFSSGDGKQKPSGAPNARDTMMAQWGIS